MKIITLYTLYGRRAGAELCFEKTVESVYRKDRKTEWIILTNKSSCEVVKQQLPYAKPIYVKWLDNQYKKAFWLEFLSSGLVENLQADCFWIPSGCNHFPGRWKIPILSTFHDLGEYHISQKYSKARMIFRKKICIPLNLKRAKCFTAVSKFTKYDMIKYLGIESERIKVVYNGATPHASDLPQNSIDIIKDLGFEDKKYFFTPGRTDYIGKGLDVLLKAYRAFASNHKEIQLILVGPQGEGHQLLVNDIENGKDDIRIHYLGRVNNDTLVSLYYHSLATVIASRFEGFGFPILEAMNYHTPIICSNAGSLEEVAGSAAIIFKSGDPKDLTEKMNMIYNANESVITEYINRGEIRLKDFSWEKCAEQMIEEFNYICGR